MSVSEDSDHFYELSAGNLDWLKPNNNTTVQFMTQTHQVNYLVDHQKNHFPPIFSGSILLLPANAGNASDSHYKKLIYRRGTARCVVSVEIFSIAMQQCRSYLYDKS